MFLPDSDVKDVWTDGRRDSHVPETFPGDNDWSDQIRNWSSSSQKGQTHYLKNDTGWVFRRKHKFTLGINFNKTRKIQIFL